MIDACNRFLDLVDEKTFHESQWVTESAVRRDYDSVMLLRGRSRVAMGSVDRALEDFERVSDQLPDLELVNMMHADSKTRNSAR